jgi:DHA2 family multidrug resistance protein
VVGGWITDNWSWQWLFLINVIPGVLAAAMAPLVLPRTEPCLGDLDTLDGYSLSLMAIALASLEIGLKLAPQQGWFSPASLVLFLLCVLTGTGFVVRTARAAHPVVALSHLSMRPFAIGCALSFCLGFGLFGSVYLMPVFLAYVRQHDAFEIGTVMLVTGVAQFATAPIAGALDSRLDPRWLTAGGFALFAFGLGCSAFQSRTADFDEMFWPQVARGVAIMFCLLPAIRLALGSLTASEVPDASALFNLTRNLGGAIGIAVIDTILYGRTAQHGEALRDRLIAGDITAARAIGLDVHLFTHRPAGVSDAAVEAYVRPLVERAAFALSTNEAWALLAAVALLGLLLVPLAGRPPGSAKR